MTCPICQGHAHHRGAPCPSCYGTGEQTDPVAPALVARRLSLRAEGWAQAAAGVHPDRRAAFLCEVAWCRLAQVETLSRAGIEPATRDAAAIRGVEAAIASGLDIEPYVVALVGRVSSRALHLILGEVRLSCDVETEHRVRVELCR